MSQFGHTPKGTKNPLNSVFERVKEMLRVEGVESSLAKNRTHCQSGKVLKHYNHHSMIWG